MKCVTRVRIPALQGALARGAGRAAATRAEVARYREARGVAKLRARQVGGAVEAGVPGRDALRQPRDDDNKTRDTVGRGGAVCICTSPIQFTHSLKAPGFNP
jgi:hypothetical protein